MFHLLRRFSAFFLSLLFLMSGSALADFAVGSYTFISKSQVDRYQFDYTYRANVTNTGPHATNVDAQATSGSPHTQVIDGSLNFGDVSSQMTVISQDTFTIRQDRRFPFDPTTLTWTVQGDIQPPLPITSIPIVTDPSAFFTGAATQVRVLAQVAPTPGLNPNSVKLYRVDAQLSPIGDVQCSLLDNGNLGNGDDIGGDSVFSCFVAFLEQSPAKIRLAAQVIIGGQLFTSEAVILDVVDPLTGQQVQTVLDVQAQAQQIWEEKLAQLGDTLEARIQTANAVKLLPGVADAGVSVDEVTIWIKYISGLEGGLMLNPPGTRGGVAARVSARPEVSPQDARDPVAFPRQSTSKVVSTLRFALAAVAADNIPIENTNVLIWDAYNSQFAPFDEGPDLQTLFQNSQCPKFNVTYLKDGQATVNSVRAFTQYGTVIMVTHGAVDGNGMVVFLTREQTSLLSILSHALDLILGRVSIMGDVFAIRPSFISSLPGSFQNTLVYNGSCQSSANNTMASAFVGEGAKTYYGYTRVVNSDFAQSVANQLFNNLVTKLDNTGDSFNPVMPKVDPTPPNATFTQTGETKLVYTGELINGGFEKGDLTGWTHSGDGRVVQTLGPFTPQDGGYMGIVSTGLGFTTDSGTIEQNFCLPKTATQLKFKWNFSSEEFIEWCGPQYPFDDTFRVELVTDSGTTVLFQRDIDSLCASVSPTPLAFDQSGPGCTPFPEDIGYGTGGNDCTVWSTDWQSGTIDISGIATANNGKGVTLRFITFDTGDSFFDSAVLLDGVEIVKP